MLSKLTFLILLISNLLILSNSSNQKQVLILLISSLCLIISKSLFLISIIFLSKSDLDKTKNFTNTNKNIYVDINVENNINKKIKNLL